LLRVTPNLGEPEFDIVHCSDQIIGLPAHCWRDCAGL
jgi:hypothetical protein